MPSLTLLCVAWLQALSGLVPQVLRSDLDLTWAPSPGIAIVTAVIVLPQISPDSFIDGQTGACQRLPAFSLALSVSLSRRPPWAASDCMFAAAPSAAAARRAGVSGAPVLPWALLKTSLSVLRRFAGAGALSRFRQNGFVLARQRFRREPAAASPHLPAVHARRHSHQVRVCPRLFGAAQSQRTRESVSIDTSSTTDGTAS